MVRATTKCRGARHEHIRPGIDALPGDLCVDTAIDLPSWIVGSSDYSFVGAREFTNSATGPRQFIRALADP